VISFEIYLNEISKQFRDLGIELHHMGTGKDQLLLHTSGMHGKTTRRKHLLKWPTRVFQVRHQFSGGLFHWKDFQTKELWTKCKGPRYILQRQMS